MHSSESRQSAARQRFEQELQKTHVSIDRAFSVLLILQWLFCVGCAFLVSPRTWFGAESAVHVHLWLAIGLGGLISSLPIALSILAPGAYLTRFVVASAQALMSGLIIHLMSGRIEAHFHVFGVLAFLSFYRDRSLYLPMVGIIAIDHLLRGLFIPESIYGIESPTLVRSIEHAMWVLYETFFLLFGITQGRRGLMANCRLRCEIEEERDQLETRVASRTAELSTALGDLRVHMDTLDRVQGRVEFDVDGVVTYANDHFATIMGYEPEELIGKHHRMLVPCEYETSEEYAAFWERLRSGEFHLGEYERVAKDGSPRALLVTYSPVPGSDGGIEKIVKYATNVTERVAAHKASEEASRRARELARLISESPNELYVFNQDTLVFEEVNYGAIRSSRYSRDELLGLTPIDLKPEYDERRFRELIQPLAQGDVCTLEFKTLHRRKDGSTYPAQVSLHRASYNELPVYVAFVADVTNVEQLEQQLSQSQKLESIGQLSAGIAHEINTPMQFVSLNLQFLSKCHERLFTVVDRYRELLDGEWPMSWRERREEIARVASEHRFEHIRDQFPKAIEECREGIDRTVRIVKAMKVFSHPGNKSKSPVDLNEAIHSAVEISRNRWKYAAEMQLELAADLPAVEVYAAEINQVLLNLIVNAADAIADCLDEGQLGTITVRTSCEHGFAQIEVEDDGCGIPAAVRKKVFDPFFTTKEVGKGTGQGLAITHNVIVNMHGGEIALRSEEGEGTTFYVKLPLDDASREDNQADQSNKLLALNGAEY